MKLQCRRLVRAESTLRSQEWAKGRSVAKVAAYARAPTRPPRWQIILYASGSLSVALSYQAFATYIQFLYIDIFGVRAAGEYE